MKRIKRVTSILFVLLVYTTGASAVDIHLRAVPEVTIPLGADGGLYSVGGGGTVHASFPFVHFFSPGVQTGIQVQPLLNVGNNLLLVRGGLEVNFFGYPISRLFIGGGGGFGLYQGMYPDSDNFTGLYWSVHADAGYRFTPAITMTAGAEFRSYLSTPEPIFSGLAINLGVHLQLGALRGRDLGVEVETIEDNPVFPILYSMYDELPVGSVRITNNEQAELRDVEVYFQAGDYTSRELLAKEQPILRRGDSMETSLFAQFNEKMLTFSEDTKIEGEVIVKYTFLDSQRETRVSKTISVHHRNAVRWEDERIAAAFISPNDPAVLEYSKYIAGVVRDTVRPSICGNLQYAMGLFEGLRLSEVSFEPDPSTPYTAVRNDRSAVDYIQYPYQTIAYKGGDSDDIGLLYAAVLESIGIRTAYIPLPEDFLIVVDLDMNEEEARDQFYYSDEFIFRNGTVWVPVQVSLIREGFMRAWMEGMELWNTHERKTEDSPFIPVVEAWKKYPSVSVYGETGGSAKPLDEKVVRAFENCLYRYIKREIDPQVEGIRESRSFGDGRSCNRLGILYATYALLPEAKEWFEKALEDDFQPAAVNLGNVAFLLEDYEGSAAYFTKALAYRPNNRAALIGLARAKYELDVFTEADELYEQIRRIDPSLAERYSYLSSRVEGALSRASSAADRKGNVLWDERE